MPKAEEKITLQPGVLRWARQRTGLGREQLAAKLRLQTEDIADWERTGRITFNDVDGLAKHTYTPLGYLYLSDASRRQSTNRGFSYSHRRLAPAA